MDLYHLERTVKSPLIKGNPENGEILIQGRSYPENAVEFYRPFLDWFDTLKNENPESISFTMDMEYFNTSTAGIVYDLITTISELQSSCKVRIIWRFEPDDHDMSSKGKSLKDHFGELFVLDEKSEE